MDHSQQQANGNFMGHIPRKKKGPSVSSSTSLSAAAPPAANIPIPRKKSFTGTNAPPPPPAFGNAIPRKNAYSPPPSSSDVAIPRKKKIKIISKPSGIERERSIDNGSERSFSSNPNQKFSRLKPFKTQNRRPSNTSLVTSTQSTSNTESSRIHIVTEEPFIIKVKTNGVPLETPSQPSERQSPPTTYGDSVGSRTPSKRSRPNVASYKELDDSDSEDFIMTEEEEKELLRRREKKRRRKLDMGEDADKNNDDIVLSGQSSELVVANNALLPAAVPGVLQHPSAIDPPPPGTLSTLWYSRECYLHVFVMEKICGWKTRPKVRLIDHKETTDDSEEPSSSSLVRLDHDSASELQQKALTSKEIWSDPKKRMEISRINPTNCPFVMALAAAKSMKDDATSNNGEKTRYKLQSVKPTEPGTYPPESGREEVLLVKWRGRSYLHCSWERATDIQRLDPSNNNTAKNKIRKYYQSQEAIYGSDWRGALAEERKDGATIHHRIPDETKGSENSAVVAEDEGEQMEEYFSPQNLEIERVLACDENEMNLGVLAKQRAINIKNEEDEQNRKETDQETSVIPETFMGHNLVQRIIDTNVPWDPEDNVRYVVKWKGLPYAEMTWEYWRDIKRDAVDEAEDFWYRQRPPDLEEARILAIKPHPHMRDFQKLQVSPVYGLSKRPRPVAKLDGDESTPSTNNDSDAGFRLRSYQLEGVNWLLFNWWNQRSCILADEMGLGKTIQSTAFLRELQTQPAAQVRGPFLIVAPLSLITQWESELKSWAPDLNVILYHGSADAREFLVDQEFYFTDQFVPKPTAVKLKKYHVTKFHVLITTYEVVLKDIAVLSMIRWRTLIVDEAHRLKNHKARLFEELAAVPRDHCVLLTGTPIANATEELWSLLHFANPDTFQDREEFLEKFGKMEGAKQVNELHGLLKPYLLRRVKEDVEKSLPNKEETILEVSLTPIQKTFYKAIYERNTSFLFKGAKANNAPSLMNVMMELRKCCNHPFLVKGAEDKILTEAAAKLSEQSSNEEPISQSTIFAEQLVKSSGKMVLIEKLLQKLFLGGHKVLIFSQMVRVLDLLEEFLKIKKYKYERLDGTTSSSSRLHAVERFKRKACQRFVMLLSTRAGGLGLNLTAADVVIIFDSDWNPQNDLQAMARAHRIGQTRAVKVYRLLTAKTYEMHMFHSASLKLGLERAVLSQNREQNDESDDGTKPTRKSESEAKAKEIDELLKKGAYDVFRDEDDAEAEKFMDTDIDQLLESKSKTVTYGATSTSSLGSGLGSFSKASFVATTDEGEKDVDLDDPEFWSKAIGLDVPPEEPTEELAAMLDDGVKRSRKQVQQYDPYAEIRLAEQLKKESLELEKMLEKEEKEKRREEKKLKKKKMLEDKKRKQLEETAKTETKKEKENEQKPVPPQMVKAEPISAVSAPKAVKLPKISKEIKPKKSKKNDRIRAIQRAENEDPAVEKFKQAWDIPQRNRVTAALIRFGFGRFCKLRYESNLSGLPLQDIEVFARCYIYQLAQQVNVTILSRISNGLNPDDADALIQQWVGMGCLAEIEWLRNSFISALQLQQEVESGRRFLRMPVTLVDSSYLLDLRHGAAFRALRRVGTLARLNSMVENAIDSVLSSLGHEELGKRGCGVTDVSNLDVDLKVRFVTSEELALAIGSKFSKLKLIPPVSWWDRDCDVSLVIGTFVHGLGNYEHMRRDRTLPYDERLRMVAEEDVASKTAAQRFSQTVAAVRQVFDNALEAARVKAELEVQAAVAAAAKAASKREELAMLVRQGGAEAEVAAKKLPETQVEDAFKFDGTDSHFVTLPRMYEHIRNAVRKDLVTVTPEAGSSNFQVVPETAKSDNDVDSHKEGGSSGGRFRQSSLLPMPDARILDHRLLRILDEMERNSVDVWNQNSCWEISADVMSGLEARNNILPLFLDKADCLINECSGVGLGGNQCGTSHRSLNDGSDFCFGSASNDLAPLAYGTDAPRYLRAIGVPMNVTRFAISGLIYTSKSCLDEMLHLERLRYYGYEDTKTGTIKQETCREIDKERVDHGKSDNLSTNADSETYMLSKKNDDLKPLSMSGNKKTSNPVDPIRLIAAEFLHCAKLRAVVCLAVNFYGFPINPQEPGIFNTELLRSIELETGKQAEQVHSLFDMSQFRQKVVDLAPDLNVPSSEIIHTYVESFLLPHCLRLCVGGNGPSTRNARGSHGNYETSFGISIYQEPSTPQTSPVPDPCLNLNQHSIEAVVMANAMLRRVRLLRSCVYLCEVHSDDINAGSSIDMAIKSQALGQLNGMPIWWCPWIHDQWLLVHASTNGLFSILKDRSLDEIFSKQSIKDFLNERYLRGEIILPDISSPPNELVNAWVDEQANQFPSLFQLERRLGILCSEATSGIETEDRFDYIPMFDHGGWPRS